jgi:peptide/nickel transport system substrate-binding protein
LATRLLDVRDIHSNAFPESFNTVNPVLDFLCVVDPTGVARGALAERWTVSEDLRSWTFHLRQDVRWRKGERLTADHVLWNWRRWIDPKVGSGYLGSVLGYMMTRESRTDARGRATETWRPWDANLFEKLDDHTIRLNLKRPAVTVAEDLFTSSTLIGHPRDEGQFQPGCDGTGPFEAVEYRVDDHAVYQAVAGSWRGSAKVDRLEYVDVGSDHSALIAALFSKQIQGLLNVSLEVASVVSQDPNLKLLSAPSAMTYMARVHCDVKPFDDPRVRKAMRLAVNPQRVLELAQGGQGLVGNHDHVCPIQPDFAATPPMRQDIPRARRLLKEAGLPNGFHTKITANAGEPVSPKTAQVLTEMWRQIGIETKIELVPNQVYVAFWKDFPLSISPWSHRPLAIMQMGLSYRTGATWNESHYSNHQVDSLIDEAQRVLDPVQRSKYIGLIQQILHEDGPLVQPMWAPTIAAFHKDIGGVSAHPMAYYPVEYLHLLN